VREGTRMRLFQSRRASTAVVLATTLIASAFAPTAAPAGERALGIDVSRFEGAIGWRHVAEAGVDFAFVQASPGSGTDCTVNPQQCGRDRRYDFNRRRAREEGIRVGAYHRAFTDGSSLRDAKRDARREARVFIAEVGAVHDHDLLPVLDFEAPFGGLDPRQLRAWVRTWLDQVGDALGARPMIYTNLSSWRATGDTMAFALAGHPLWVANWGVSEPLVPAGDWAGRGWSVWQYTNLGRVDGIRGRVSLDRLGVPLRRISVG
jgi:lysozyme